MLLVFCRNNEPFRKSARREGVYSSSFLLPSPKTLKTLKKTITPLRPPCLPNQSLPSLNQIRRVAALGPRVHPLRGDDSCHGVVPAVRERGDFGHLLAVGHPVLPHQARQERSLSFWVLACVFGVDSLFSIAGGGWKGILRERSAKIKRQTGPSFVCVSCVDLPLSGFRYTYVWDNALALVSSLLSF